MARDPWKTLSSSFRKRRAIEDPIASDISTYMDHKGRSRTAQIAVGRPARVPDGPEGDWFCPVYVEGWTGHVNPAIGVGPLDALMNALTVVRGFQDHVGTMHIRYDTNTGRARARGKRSRK